MLKKYNYLLPSLLLALLMTSCHSDVGEVNPGTEQTNQITVPLIFGEVQGDLIGYIFDDSNNPVAGAKVSIYSGETTTNDFGVFTFKDAKLDPQGTFLKVEKSGYLIGSDLVYPSANGKGTSKVLLLKIINEPVFQASEGGIIAIEGGGTITFPPFGLIRANGSLYDGEVKATAYRLSPSNIELGDRMAGGLLGIDKKGRHRVLSTYGILAIELRGFDNQKLKIKSDKVAELSLPIESDMQNFVEDDVPTWNFDFESGVWNENNLASNDKEHFHTSINSLGFWNIALPNAVSQVCGRLIYNNELPAKNYVIQILNEGLPSRIGITDQDGYFCGKVPQGETLTLQVMHPVCGEILKELFLNPFEDVGTIGDMILEVGENYVSGTVLCEGESNANVTIIIKNNDHTNIFYPNSNGTFSINLEEFSCNSSSTYSIFAYDNSTEKASDILNLSINFSGPLKLEVCEDACLSQGVFMYEKEDYCTDGDYSRAQIIMTNGSGEYTYEWQDGSESSFFNNPSPGDQICVKVIDKVTECNYTFCDEASSYKRLSIVSIYSSNTECLKKSGFVALEIEGGRDPIYYEWTGPAGFTSSDQQLKDLSPGTYSLIIQDGGGCEVTETSVVFDVTTPIASSKEDFCDVSIITIEENDGYKPYTYHWSAGEAIANQLYIYTPGVYKLTMTDANSCSRSTSLTISKAGSLPVIDPIYNCNKDKVTFTELQSGYEYYYQSFGSNDKIPVNVVLGDVDISILEAGYRFNLGSENPNFSDCNVSEEIILPRFEGLEIGAVTSATCETCADGHIEYEAKTDGVCQNCTLGEVRVIRSENGVDVTDLNAQKQLENGEYYVIVLDSNNGCYIAHSLVILE